MDTDIASKPGSPYYWGPRVWKILHLLAEFPVQTINEGCWKHIIHRTSYVMPCEVCREHMKEYFQTHKVTSNIREELWDLHNNVNERNMKPKMSYEDLSVYTNVAPRERIEEVNRLMLEIQEAWTSVSHIISHPLLFNEWKKYIFLFVKHIKDQHRF